MNLHKKAQDTHFYFRYQMLNRYPSQTRSRRGSALVGVVFLAFALFMALIESGAGVFTGLFFGLILLMPSILLNEVHFGKFEKVLSKFSSFGSLS